MYTPPPSDSEPLLIKKVRYHHNHLKRAAIRVGLEIVKTDGPEGLTLRGLARRLGVTAPALVYHFGNRVGLCEAVAAAALERAREGTALCAAKGQFADVRSQCEDWLDFVSRNANVYRFMCGESWRCGNFMNGYQGYGNIVETPLRALEATFYLQSVAMHRPQGNRVRARHLAMALHALALARLDGTPADIVQASLDRLLAMPGARDPFLAAG